MTRSYAITLAQHGDPEMLRTTSIDVGHAGPGQFSLDAPRSDRLNFDGRGIRGMCVAGSPQAA
jgi:hypothetical protein